MKSRLPMLALVLGLASPLVHAQMLQPGLWELTSSNMQVDGKPLPDMEFMLGQLKNLPPEQRAMIEGGLAKQGISVGGKGAFVPDPGAGSDQRHSAARPAVGVHAEDHRAQRQCVEVHLQLPQGSRQR